MLPLQDDEQDDGDYVDPADQLLTKYDDVGEVALRKKRANRIQIGGGGTLLSEETTSNETKDTAAVFDLPKKQVGSDYYATNEEDPILSSSTKGFKKKQKVGNKRSRINPLALADNEEEDIVAALEG